MLVWRALRSCCLVALLLAMVPALLAAQGRPDCATVLRKLREMRGRVGGTLPASIDAAQDLGTDSEWVERCAVAYGRRVKKNRHSLDEAGWDQLAEVREAEEFEELSREESETEGDEYFTVLRKEAEKRGRLAEVRNEDLHEWEAIENREWDPTLSPHWRPVLRAGDED